MCCFRTEVQVTLSNGSTERRVIYGRDKDSKSVEDTMNRVGIMAREFLHSSGCYDCSIDEVKVLTRRVANEEDYDHARPEQKF